MQVFCGLYLNLRLYKKIWVNLVIINWCRLSCRWNRCHINIRNHSLRVFPSKFRLFWFSKSKSLLNKLIDLSFHFRKPNSAILSSLSFLVFSINYFKNTFNLLERQLSHRGWDIYFCLKFVHLFLRRFGEKQIWDFMGIFLWLKGIFHRLKFNFAIRNFFYIMVFSKDCEFIWA